MMLTLLPHMTGLTVLIACGSIPFSSAWSSNTRSTVLNSSPLMGDRRS
jgi:hypothetical protein